MSVGSEGLFEFFSDPGAEGIEKQKREATVWETYNLKYVPFCFYRKLPFLESARNEG